MDELSHERRDELIEAMARRIVGRRLEVPAVLFLEMHKPFTFLASQATVVLFPFLAAILGAKRVGEIQAFLKDEDNIERLLRRIEDLSGEECIGAKHERKT